jgi:hypothetical protein
MQRREGRRYMTRSQHSTSLSTDDPRGVVDPDLVDAFRKLSTLKADYETMRLDYMEDCLLPVFNACRVANGIEPAPVPNRPPVVLEELVALRKEYEAWEAWKAELDAACNEEPRPQKQRDRKPSGPKLESLTKLIKSGVARIEKKPDGTVNIFASEPELADADNQWPTLRKKK